MDEPPSWLKFMAPIPFVGIGLTMSRAGALAVVTVLASFAVAAVRLPRLRVIVMGSVVAAALGAGLNYPGWVDRAGSSVSGSASAVTSTAPALGQTAERSSVRDIEVVVQGGYKPNRIEIKAGERVRLKFLRQEHSACSREVVFPALGIRRELPPFQTVVIELPALAPGEYEMKCGMNMIRGTLVVTAA